MSDEKKWTAGPDLGPRMGKAFNEAWRDLRWEACKTITLSGTKGVDEHRTMTTIIPPICHNPEMLKEITDALGEKYGWVVNAKNYKALIVDIGAGKKRLEAAIPVKDERITPEEDANNKAEGIIRACKRETEMAKKAEADAVEKSRLIKENPSLDHSDGKRGGVNLASANIKTELMAKWPRVAWSVRLEKFANGNSIDIRWKGGPTVKEVKVISGKYESGNFDGMADMYNYHSSVWKNTFGESKYIHENRDIDNEMAIVTAALKEKMPDREDHNIRHAVWTLMEKTSLEPGAEITGIHYDEETCDWVADLKVPEKPEALEPTDEPPAGPVVVRENEEKNGVEIVFADKPGPGTLDELKRHGFRWSRFSKLWYAKRTPDKMEYARALAAGMAA